MREGIVVVDYECMSAAGQDLASTWRNMVEGRSGLRRMSRYAPLKQKLPGLSRIAYAAEVPLSLEELAGSREKLQKWREPGFHAVTSVTRRLLTRIGFDMGQHDPQRVSLLGATALSTHYGREQIDQTQEADPKYILNQCHNIPLGAAASEYGMQGPSFSVGSACASSAHALLLASHLLRAGLIDCALVVGYEFPVLPHTVGGLEWAGALYRRDDPTDRAYEDAAQASRPFSRDRRGFVLAEGVGAVLLSRADYARGKDWPVRGWLRGGYSNSDAGHLTRLSVSNVAHCMSQALVASGVSKDEVGFVSAHATSTPLGDQGELLSLREVFGDRLKQLPVVANKSQLGHSLGASAMLAFILALEAMREGVLPPTLNHIRDPELPEALISPEAREHHHQLALLNSFGFGGTNVALVVESPR